jgi:hypothetical protein
MTQGVNSMVHTPKMANTNISAPKTIENNKNFLSDLTNQEKTFPNSFYNDIKTQMTNSGQFKDLPQIDHSDPDCMRNQLESS